MNTYDAIVAGAGIWGCTVARRLAESGKRVGMSVVKLMRTLALKSTPTVRTFSTPMILKCGSL